jgi:hypothetical protein
LTTRSTSVVLPVSDGPTIRSTFMGSSCERGQLRLSARSVRLSTVGTCSEASDWEV